MVRFNKLHLWVEYLTLKIPLHLWGGERHSCRTRTQWEITPKWHIIAHFTFDRFLPTYPILAEGQTDELVAVSILCWNMSIRELAGVLKQATYYPAFVSGDRLAIASLPLISNIGRRKESFLP